MSGAWICGQALPCCGCYECGCECAVIAVVINIRGDVMFAVVCNIRGAADRFGEAEIEQS